MSDYNKVILMGRLSRDVELKYTNSNTAVANVSLATGREWTDKQSGEKQKETCFVECTAWGRTAEIMGQHLKKGDPAFIEGRLQLDQWQDKETGANRSKIKVVIERFQFVGGKGNGEQSHAGQTSGAASGGGNSQSNDGDVPW